MFKMYELINKHSSISSIITWYPNNAHLMHYKKWYVNPKNAINGVDQNTKSPFFLPMDNKTTHFIWEIVLICKSWCKIGGFCQWAKRWWFCVLINQHHDSSRLKNTEQTYLVFVDMTNKCISNIMSTFQQKSYPYSLK